MKRHPALRQLSSDHHIGLVLARKARQAANELRQGVGELLSEIGPALTSEADEAIAVEARRLLDTLAS